MHAAHWSSAGRLLLVQTDDFSASDEREMAQPFRARLLEVTVTAQQPTLWKWDISERGVEIMYGFETSRETAQIRGDNALFMLLSERPS
jgi:hypothetical protein